jgi:hypothetical protein
MKADSKVFRDLAARLLSRIRHPWYDDGYAFICVGLERHEPELELFTEYFYPGNIDKDLPWFGHMYDRITAEDRIASMELRQTALLLCAEIAEEM